MSDWAKRHLPPSFRVMLIRAALFGISDISKRLILGKALAKSAPCYHVKYRPNWKPANSQVTMNTGGQEVAQ